MYYSYKELEELDDTLYDDDLVNAYIAEYESSLPVSDTDITEVEGFSDDALFEPLRELLED
ncbi:MAG: hypothetical protein IIW92_12640 [Lachnospiraceae bacterium]|nr:hypothetical protein [Lachnospiraceae bacterium]MBQ5919402.1 hypothetical protein [Lachnospiraceae bacterium]